jgi:hypothetical protein
VQVDCAYLFQNQLLEDNRVDPVNVGQLQNKLPHPCQTPRLITTATITGNDNSNNKQWHRGSGKRNITI